MLPVFIYEPDEASRHELLRLIGDGFQLNMSSPSAEYLLRALDEENGLLLTVLGAHAGNIADCIRLNRHVLEKNRDNYTLLCIHDSAAAGELLSNCMRPAGILIAPWGDDAVRQCLMRIRDDHATLTGAGGCLEFEAESSVYRVRHDDILYLEAINKKLNICTSRQRITVRIALNALEELLPESFLRVHRAFIVNTQHIAKVDYADMTITLTNDELIPVARARRDELKQYFSDHASGTWKKALNEV